MKRIRSYLLLSLMAGCVFCGTSSCSVEEAIQDASVQIVSDYKMIRDYESIPQKTISWENAKTLLLQNNLELRKARAEIRNAKQNVKKVFLDLIPLVNLGYYYNTALFGNGENYDSKNYNYNINVVFSIPELTQLPITYYVAQLALFRAEKNYELKEREVISKLYQCVLNIDFSKESFFWDKQSISNIETEIQKQRLEKKRELELKKEWLELATLLAEVNVRYLVDVTTIPKITDETFVSRGQQIDPLILTMMAMELEASRLKKLGIFLRYWPTVKINFYSPSLFTYSGGSNQGFQGRGDDTRMELNFYLQLDTRLQNYFAMKEADTQHFILIEALKLQMLERREKINLLLKSGKEFVQWEKNSKKHQVFLERQNNSEAELFIQLRKNKIAAEKEKITQQKSQVERNAALILEYGFIGDSKNPNSEALIEFDIQREDNIKDAIDKKDE